MKKLLILLFALLPGLVVRAQTFTVMGMVKDKITGSGLQGAVVTLTGLQDSTRKVSGASGQDGRFRLETPAAGDYRVNIQFVGYHSMTDTVAVTGERNFAGMFAMEPGVDLTTVEIKDQMPLAVQNGDTTQYNSDAYKVNKDATGEDLILKMPGMTNENGTLKSQGEDVKKVLVDGKPYFGDDPNLTLKNIPADIVDKIQVYDKWSDQSEFTGFDDGNSMRTINIITKKDGQFGKVYGGLGQDYRYVAGASINLFDGARKITLLGMSNNINQQNFSSEDLVGISGASMSSFGMMGGGGFGGRGGRGGSGNMGMMSGGPSFMVGQQNGVATTHGAGLNYIDTWGKKKNVSITASYFFNTSVNYRNQLTAREYFLGADSSQFYNESSIANSTNYNHRANLRMEFTLDSMNSLIFTPRFSYQRNISDQYTTGDNRDDLQSLINLSNSGQTNNREAYMTSGELLFRHRFRKTGRTLSVTLGGNYNWRNAVSSLRSVNTFYTDTIILSDTINQQGTQLTESYRANMNTAYTEPIGKSGSLSLNYAFTYDFGHAPRQTYRLNPLDSTYSTLDTLLSNSYDNRNITNRFTAAYRLRGKKFNFSVGVGYENILFYGYQLFPLTDTVDRVYHNVLPNAMFTYRFTKSSNLRINYRTYANLPSVNQLQTVVDNSNPLLLSSGNASLVQNFSHNLSIRYNQTNTNKATTLFLMAGVTYTQNYIGSSVLIAARDTTLPDGTFLGQGAQLSMPVNLDGYVSARSFFTFGFPVKKIKTNININTGVNYARTPGLINGQTNYSNSVTLSQGIVFSSNISEKLDFTISYTGSYNIVLNTVRQQNNSNYFNQTANVKFNWQFWKGMFVNTQLNHYFYTGLTDGFNQNVFLWNASLGYKFLKDESLELKVTVFDILGQNNSVSRSVTETYVEDVTSNVIGRYVMGVITYNLKNFAKKEEAPKP